MMNDIAKRIKELILASDKSLMTISHETGIPYPTLAHWLYKYGTPNARNIIDLCTYFNVSADWLLGLKETK